MRSPEPADIKQLDHAIQAHPGKSPQTCITSTAGETFCYTVANRTEGRLLSVIGAQLGSLVASRLSQKRLERSMDILFIGVGAIVLGEIIVRHRALAHLLG
ncbi:MAG: hypothetical protein ACFCVD_00405 [Nodosilinea sp.]